MKGQGSGVLKSNNRGRWSKNGEGESARSDRVASTEEYERHVKVFRVGKLL